MNITAIGTVARDADGALDFRKFLVPLKGASGKIAAIAVAVPFLRPSDVPEMPDAADPYLDGIRELYGRAADAARTLRDSHYPRAVLVALGHCHLQDGEESRDSERRLVVGGAEALKAEVFPADFAYVALGHLHKPQEFQSGRIQYSGSPIPLSFSEKDYPHRVVEVEVDSTGLRCTTLLIPKTASLIRLPEDGAKPIDDVLQSIDATCFDAGVADDERPFLEVRVLDDGPDPTRRSRIERALHGKAVRLATIKLESPLRAGGADFSGEAEAALADLSTIDPADLLRAAHIEKYGAEPDAELVDALREILATETTATGT